MQRVAAAPGEGARSISPVPYSSFARKQDKARRSFWLMFAIGLLPVEAVYSQTAPQPQFEVASIKPAGPYVQGQQLIVGGPGSNSPGRVTFNRVWLGLLLAQAYAVNNDQISGPEWLFDLTNSGYRYTITATMPADTTRDQYRLMLQNLLAERFHVRLHHETQSRPGYELVVAKDGPKMREWTPESDVGRRQPQAVKTISGIPHDEDGFPQLPPGQSSVSMITTTSDGMVWRVQRTTMDSFARGLGGDINRSNGNGALELPQPRVVDHTGLTAVYEIRLKYAGWVTPPRPASPQAGGETAVPVAGDPTQNAPDIFSAVRQLGLKLQKVDDVKVDVLVVDHADRVPTEN